MSEYSESVGMMFPTNWPEDMPDAHCTLIYLGDKSDMPVDRAVLEAVVARLGYGPIGPVPTKGLALFGPENDVLVTLLDPTKLQPIRDSYERTLAKVGVENGSEYKDYRPHVTIKTDYQGTLEDAINNVTVPKEIYVGGPQLWWGDDHEI